MFKKVLASLAFAAMSMSASAAVEINKGSVADFDGLPGVGPALSKRIVDARQQAEFKDWPDFMARVKGVKQKSAAKLSAAGLTVNGKPFDGAAEGSAAKKSTAAKKSSAH
ncbi:MAG TPA: helix-hairpin-helix domain-containing protein [Burkholderiaceae bacterium]|nr:helix-hairpin-helix domain-containing protein [Burkholderiaceae bacterium]